MSNDWGKPFTPEELAKKASDGWGNPLLPKVTPATINSTPEELREKGWVQTAHDEWEKIAPDTSPFAGSKVTLTYVDETHIPAWTPTPVNSVGSYYAEDGTFMNADGTRSIFDDVDAGPDGDPMQGWSYVEPVNPTCYAWHPESGCGVIFADRASLEEALQSEPLLVEMTKEEYDEANKIRAADWPTHPDQLSPMTVEQQEPEPVKPQSELTKALQTIMAPGFGEREPLTPDEPEHPDCTAPYAERTAPVDTFSEADGPWYVVYFGPVLYTVLAGPYDTQEDATARLDRVWAQFEKDAAYDYSFPTRERSGLRATTVRSVYNLKGAYGKQ
jgi:hypothetical protein